MDAASVAALTFVAGIAGLRLLALARTGLRRPSLQVLGSTAGIASAVFCWLAVADSRLNLRHPAEATLRVWLCVDVSRSMLAEDAFPNRLQRVKDLYAKAIDALPDAEFAVLAFAGEAELACPFTSDREFLRLAIEDLTIDSVYEGGSDLLSAMEFLAQRPVRPGTVELAIVASDGGHTVVTLEAGAKSQPERRSFCLIGVGDPAKASEIPTENGRRVLDRQGRPILTQLNEDHLLSLAKAVGGTYVPARTHTVDLAAIVNAAYLPLATSTRLPTRLDAVRWFILAAFVLFTLDRLAASASHSDRPA